VKKAPVVARHALGLKHDAPARPEAPKTNGHANGASIDLGAPDHDDAAFEKYGGREPSPK
jgi:hypothetical protein